MLTGLLTHLSSNSTMMFWKCADSRNPPREEGAVAVPTPDDLLDEAPDVLTDEDLLSDESIFIVNLPPSRGGCGRTALFKAVASSRRRPLTEMAAPGIGTLQECDCPSDIASSLSSLHLALLASQPLTSLPLFKKTDRRTGRLSTGNVKIGSQQRLLTTECHY